MRLIDADTVVHWESYDDEHETIRDNTGTIADFLDSMTDEGCPETVDAIPVVRCNDCKFYHQMTAETGICKLACRHLGNDGFCSEGESKDGNRHD